MSEPCLSIVGSDEREGFGDGLVEVLFASGPSGAEALFDLCPGFFDGIEIGRIGRQIEHFRFPSLNQFAHPFDLGKRGVMAV